ncbi:MAG TPA: hypothetical protein VK923_01280 [Euzebyales bacterium]|nr:hypothetical protein [Euzebyales bacterium]
MLAVLISALVERSVLSTAVVFLACGVLIKGIGIVPESPEEIVELIAELALFSVLFTDGMLVGIRDLAVAWRPAGPCAAARHAVDADRHRGRRSLHRGPAVSRAFLLGAALSPTDPVFASAIVGRPEVPYRLRHCSTWRAASTTASRCRSCRSCWGERWRGRDRDRAGRGRAGPRRRHRHPAGDHPSGAVALLRGVRAV